MRVSTLSGTTNPNIYLLNNYFNNGIGTQATFNMPSGVAIDSRGVAYAFDTNCPVIRKIMPDGVTSTFAGKANFIPFDATKPAGTTNVWQRGFIDGTAPEFANITAICVDSQDNVIVADNNRIRIINQNGLTRTINQDNTLFKNVVGLVTDAQGNIYVADNGDNKLKKVDTNGNITTLYSGFNSLNSVCFDNLGNFIVADGSTIKRINTSGVVTPLAFNLNNVSGVASLGAEIYFTRNFDNKICKLDINRNVVDVAGTGQGGFRDTSTVFFWRLPLFQNPNGIAIKNGVILVADTWNQRIRKIEL